MDEETLREALARYRDAGGPSYEEFARGGGIDRPGGSELSYSRFFREFLVPNRPCVLSGSVTAAQPAPEVWRPSSNGDGFPKIHHRFSDAVVPVANCDVQEYNANPKESLTLSEYLSYWRERRAHGHTSPRGCLYLKDWHMHRDFPDHGVYSTPLFFRSDWLNEYWDSIRLDDYRFVYMGPKGSCWSANLCGRKRWLLFPPGEEAALRDRAGSLAYDVLSPALRDPQLYPGAAQSHSPIEVIQEPGEVLFVPSGWYHQVHNLEDTISVNHNWLNGCNVDTVWRFLRAELSAVQDEIGEWRDSMADWHQHCQVMMKSCTGMDFSQFYVFLETIARNRMEWLDSGLEDPGPGGAQGSELGRRQAMFDLHRVGAALESLLADADFTRLEVDSPGLGSSPGGLLREVREVADSALT
uniref:Jumonji domain-containing protein 4 n=1 Tax=Callorhinchus milii TaxID=7868 RepID=A0A4W3HTH0_CALMI